MLFLSLILLSTLILLLTYYILLLQKRYQYFSQREIPTPPFEFFFGHLRTLWNASAYHRQLESWTKQFGKIYGVYEGHDPMFVVSDPDFIQEVFVKQYSVFNARKSTVLDNAWSAMFLKSGANWRRQRHVLNPAFTAGKLKAISPLINRCISSLMEKLLDHAASSDEFNIYPYYKRLTMDVICSCAFGIDIDAQNNPNNMYFKKVVEIMTGTPFTKFFLFKCSQVMPMIGVIISQIFSIDASIRTFINTRLLPLVSSTMQLKEVPLMWLKNRMHNIIEQRQKILVTRMDLLHLMLQSMSEETITDTANDSKVTYRLSQDEVASNIASFMTAGYETTSAVLACATYELAKHPEILQKLQDEIDQLQLSTDDNTDDEAKKYPDYDAIAKMPYMDLFVSEVLRMYPNANFVIQRRALEDTVTQGIKVDKGTIVYVDLYSVHFDAGLWGPDDPYLFVPERHLTKRHPMAYLPFGAGPRHCIGQPFGLIEIKIFLMRLLRDYTVLPGEHLESGFQFTDKITIAPKEVWVRLEKRKA